MQRSRAPQQAAGRPRPWRRGSIIAVGCGWRAVPVLTAGEGLRPGRRGGASTRTGVVQGIDEVAYAGHGLLGGWEPGTC
jgi:hypothetical protein